MALLLPPNSPPPSIDDEIVTYLKTGYAPAGWEGRPTMELAWNREDQRFEIWDQANDGSWYIVCRNRPGQRLMDMNIFKRLVEMDRQRGFDPATAVNAHNAKIEADIIKAKEPMVEASADKLRWALKKDLGHKI